MSDFDFDEIDKAVTGALGSDTQPTDDTPAVIRDTPEEAPTQDVAPTRSSVPAARRSAGGRFMDMVHPSSDMRRTTNDAKESVTTESRVPQPPSFYPEPETKSEDTRDAEQASPWSAPLESPFLPDAKVEKRPLGGSGDTVPAAPLFSQPSEELLEAPEDELKLEAPDEPLLEATTMPDPIEFSQRQNGEPEETTESIAEPVSPEPEPTPVEQPPLVEEELVGPASITQQYKEHPATEPQSGAIYDTESYHQPLAHPAKKHSSAWVILWIFLLVILGAGVGVAFYLYVLPLI